MSREAVVEFLGKVRADTALREALGPNPTPEGYVSHGSRAGHVFTLAELRSVINADRFYATAANDPALAARMSTARDDASVVALAAEIGLVCELEDLKTVLLPLSGAELSDTLLDAVSGGAGGRSFPDVGKVPGPSAPLPIPYPNFR